MPPRPKITTLPDEVGAELDRRLKAQGFGGHAELAEWLSAQGYEISKSAVQRYSADLAERLERFRRSAEVAKALAETMPDDQGELGDMLTRTVQVATFEALGQMVVDPTKLRLPEVGSMVAKLNATAVSEKKWRADFKKRLDAATKAATKIATEGGLSADKVNLIKAEFLGLGG